MTDLIKELNEFMFHCNETDKLQVSELQRRAIKEIQKLRTQVAELTKERDELKQERDTSNVKHDLEQHRQGFWNGFESARCNPDEMNIKKQWELTLIFNQAQGESK